MRLAVLLATALVMTACKREAQEAVAQAKGAAADAERAAKEAAAQARNAAEQARAAADEAGTKARGAADEAAAKARSAADEAASKARGAAGAAGDSARQGLDNASQAMRELAAGDQVQGVLVTTSRTELDVRPTSGPVKTLHTDDRTRWILHGAAGGREGFPIGSTVRVTYIVKDGQMLATQVEAVGR
ncbi:MAG TPA: hypothetical protein VFD38_13345 [Myxococcaceae bacterium]|nr:hypothetical protein [Myxococcaceae bacterium]